MNTEQIPPTKFMRKCVAASRSVAVVNCGDSVRVVVAGTTTTIGDGATDAVIAADSSCSWCLAAVISWRSN